MPPPNEENEATEAQDHSSEMALKLEPHEITAAEGDDEDDDEYTESDHFEAGETYKAEKLDMEHYDEDQYVTQNSKGALNLMDIIEGGNAVSFETMNAGTFESGVHMETEADASNHSSQQEAYFPMACDKRENETSLFLTEANLLADGGDSLSVRGRKDSKQLLFDGQEEEEDEDMEGTEEYLQEMTSAEQVVETTESEIPAELMAEVEADPEPQPVRTKAILSKDGNLLQLKTTLKKVEGARAPLKRPLLPGPGQPKVLTKVIIQGNPSSGNMASQPFRIVGTGCPRTITLAQAQQMGLKLQQIVPPSPGSAGGQKRVVVKKILPPNTSLLSPTAKSPTKILPAPPPLKQGVARPQVTTLRGAVSVANLQTVKGGVSTIKTISSPVRTVPVTALAAMRQPGVVAVSPKAGSVKTLPNTKMIIRQGPLPIKSTIISPSAGQVIRIPPNSTSFQPIQIGGGKQVQYVRFVSTTASTVPSSVLTTAKSKVVKVPAGQAQYKTIPIAPGPAPAIKTVLPKPALAGSPVGKRILIPASQGLQQLCIANDVAAAGSEGTDGAEGAEPGKSQLRSTATFVTQLKAAGKTGLAVKSAEGNVIPVGQISQDGSFVVSEGSIVMLSPEMVQQIQSGGEEEDRKDGAREESMEEESFDKENIDSDGRCSTSPGRLLEANGIRLKKPCNCTRSQCLKLYCECFANGEFCFQCNCNNCYNNIEHEEERQKSIKTCLERNPSAFRPKIQQGENEEDERRHNKGCHCKRSGCLKNYCECYEAKITCSKYCKCLGCRNTEEFLESSRSGLLELADLAEESFNSEHQRGEVTLRGHATGAALKQPYNFMSSEVVEATCQCLLAQAEEAERSGLTREEGEKLIIEEFGRCLVQIIGFSKEDDVSRL